MECRGSGVRISLAPLIFASHIRSFKGIFVVDSSSTCGSHQILYGKRGGKNTEGMTNDCIPYRRYFKCIVYETIYNNNDYFLGYLIFTT